MLEIRSRSTNINDHHRLYGGRCFIVASGPSLLQMPHKDMAELEGEYTFAISSLMRWKDLPFTPTFYLSQEIRYWWVYSHLLDEIQYPGLRMHSNQYSEFLPAPWVLVHRDEDREIEKGEFNGFGPSLEWVASRGGSATLIVCQVACFMGFDEVYLLGCEAEPVGYVWDPTLGRNAEDTDRFIRCASVVEKIMRGHDRRLVDLTPNGKLTIPKASLAEVLRWPRERGISAATL